ncbi:MAG TPA: DUF4352 domain-containing protein [Candidatus Saccharimonadales bacterium]|nr:DUF4352 domain-containing protein [Candidatus Saccharimonadales bacterium]
MADKDGNWFKRHKILTGILVLIVLGVIVSVSNGSGSNNQSDNQASSGSSNNSKPATAKIGQPVRDGKFEFTVKGMKCGEKSVGNEFIKAKAQGQFCRVSLTVKNIGDEAQTLDGSSQYAFNASGQKYSADDEAAIDADIDNNSGSTWYNDINPGNTVKGDLFFDVPAGVKPVKVELHDSAFSNGVEVDLK